MENQWEAIFTYANFPPDHPYLPNVDKPVYVLGTQYYSLKDRDAIADHLRSLFWMTYRKGFSPIVVPNGLMSDAGWGCMHRCGQMMLAEAITRVRLGERWRWAPGCQLEAYNQLRRMFQDNKCALYSIQNVTMLGMAVDKPLGSWFGPNTVAQVIKKLAAYDPVVNWYVHISVEDGVILDEIKSRCKKPHPFRSFPDSSQTFPAPLTPPVEGAEFDWNLEAIKARFAEDAEVIDIPLYRQHRRQLESCPPPHVNGPVTRDLDEDFLEIVLPPTFEFEQENANSPLPLQSTSPCTDQLCPPSVPAVEDEPSVDLPTAPPTASNWRPLLLFIPLRLGLCQPNPCYFNALKAALQIKQCVGILGGRPSHAVWIVGFVYEDDLICLDPHTTQPASQDDLTAEDDLTHHCDSPIRMSFKRLDPSMVLGFVCTTEAEFDQLCTRLEQDVLSPEVCGGHPLFEVHPTRPSNLPPIPSSNVSRSDKLSDSQSIAEPSDSNEDGVLEDGVEGDTYSDEQNSQRQGESRLDEAMNAVRTLWTKCNRVAGDTVRSLASFRSPNNGSGTEFELV
ncbi:hypothetical protein P879_00444 [Paragonimus westermani]|uniref:Cysteine protease n=1 Tax=Paragonimus westermani TaxID=34504 RepID=A0A8T0DXF5_9TREM|nr:hypothetical protein P879_00444 [Paragonimus westermani]